MKRIMIAVLLTMSAGSVVADTFSGYTKVFNKYELDTYSQVGVGSSVAGQVNGKGVSKAFAGNLTAAGSLAYAPTVQTGIGGSAAIGGSASIGASKLTANVKGYAAYSSGGEAMSFSGITRLNEFEKYDRYTK